MNMNCVMNMNELFFFVFSVGSNPIMNLMIELSFISLFVNVNAFDLILRMFYACECVWALYLHDNISSEIPKIET